MERAKPCGNSEDYKSFEDFENTSCDDSMPSLVTLVKIQRKRRKFSAKDKNPPQTRPPDAGVQYDPKPASVKLHSAVDSLVLFPLKESSKRERRVSRRIWLDKIAGKAGR